MIIQVISFVVIFGLIVFVHELGHFLAARAVDAKVNEFAMGFGPAIVTKKGKETLFTLRALPLGGYVKMQGEDSSSGEDDDRSISDKSPPKKIFVFMSGALMNFLLAAVLFICINLVAGIPTGTNVIGDVQKGSPAEVAGILPGDRIVAVNAIQTDDWTALTEAISKSSGKVDALIERNEKQTVLTVEPIAVQGRTKIGIVQSFKFSIGESFVHGVGKTVDIARDITVFIVTLPFKGFADTGDIVGPVGLFKVVGDASSGGIITLVYLTALLSVNLGVFNLLPFPALDGGRIVVSLVEIITRRRVDPEKEGRFHLIGFALLMMLIIYTVINDISRAFGG